MDTNKMREEFEVWVLRECPNQTMGRFNDGEYHSTTVQYCWLSWQASREAVIVTLPQITGREYDPLADADYREGCREAIEAQGLRVTP